MARTTTNIVRTHEGLAGHHRIILHTTEGILNAEDLPGFFRRLPAGSRTDAHMAIDRHADAVHMIHDSQAAWQAAAYNSTSLGIEQCGFASWSTRDWIVGYRLGLLRVAAALSNWSIKYGIPLKHSVKHGVCYHRDLGAAGGGHWDPGYHYPMRYVLYLARIHYYRHKGWNKKRSKLHKFHIYKAYCWAVNKRYGLKPRTKL